MILSSKRYEKGNRTSQNRLSAIGALRLKTAGILAGVTQLHNSPGSLHWNRAKPRSSTSRPLMDHSSPKSPSSCPECARGIRRLPRNAGRATIWLYRHTLSPLVGYNCRHLPTCSVYGDGAIERFGLWRGGWMTLARLVRCQPWGTSGIDNVPQTAPPGARWYLPWRYGRWRGVNGP
jgi:putative membrane protein insertion efficiency factor